MVHIDDLAWMSAAGSEPSVDPSDRDAAAVVSLRQDVRATGERFLAGIDAVKRDRMLSPEGRLTRSAQIAEQGIATLNDYLRMDAMRANLRQRQAAIATPDIHAVPAALVPILHAKLAATDSALRFQALTEAVEMGDLTAAILAVNLPSPLRQEVLTDRQRDELVEAIRLKAHPRETRRATDLAVAIASVETAVKGVSAMLRSAGNVAARSGLEAA